MPNYFYEKELAGDRQTALRIVSSIEAEFERYVTSSHKDAPKNCLKYAQNLLNTFYHIYRSAKERAHYDIFVDIYVRILSPNLDAKSSPIHFKNLLQHLEHLFTSLASFKLHEECEDLYKCITAQQLKWTDIDDFKSLLRIHGNNIILLCKQLGVARSQSIDQSLVKLRELFKHFSERLNGAELNDLDLTNSFMKSFKIYSNQGRALLLTNLTKNQKEILFNTYFELLGAVSPKILEITSAADEKFQAQLRGLNYFLKLDVSDNLEHQLAVKYGQISFGTARAQEALAQHEYIAYCAKFIYNFFKLCYVRVIAKNFKENYSRFCAGFPKLIAETSKQVWLQELLLLVFQLQINMEPTSGEAFKIFWAQLDDELFAMHFDFLHALMQALVKTTYSEFFQYNCCGKEMFSRHNQITLATLCIETYGFMLRKHESCSKEPLTPSMLAINDKFKKIFKCALSAFMDMDNNCRTVQQELQKFNGHFTNLMTAVKNPKQARFFIELAQEYMENWKGRISSADRQLLMRRLYQLGAKTNDAATAAELHCYYIAELIVSKSEHTLPLSLQNQVHFFYTGIAADYIAQGNCLVEIYLRKSSDDKATSDDQSFKVFKPLLGKRQLRLMHWLEAQFVFKNLKMDSYAALYVSLAKRSLSKYDLLLAVSAGNLYEQSSIKSKVENVYGLLRDAKIKANSVNAVTASFKRMDELTLAHAACLLWTERNWKREKNLNKNNFVEDNLAKLMQDKSLINLNVQNEMVTLEFALDALNAFKGFYEKADFEQIDINEGGFIDWTRILEDLTSLAYYFQISGYIDYAYETWLLHYRIAKTIRDAQSYVRSLTFFCEFNHLFVDESNNHEKRLNLVEELASVSPELTNILKDLPQLLRRYQNLTLICLCQMAYFYATKGRHEAANFHLKCVRESHAKLGRNSSYYDIVLFTADLVQFRIKWKLMNSMKIHGTDCSDCNGVECKQTSLTIEFDAILQRLENFAYISSIDKALFDLLLMSAISDLADFTANRLIENNLGPYFACCLKLSTDYGAAILTVKLLSKWATINLQMEYLQRAEIKFLLIECILGLRDIDEVSKSLELSKKSEVAVAEQQSSCMALNSGLDLVRKAAVNSHKFLRINTKQIISAMAFDLKLNSFLDINQNEITTQQHQDATPLKSSKEAYLLWARFVLGTLRARFNFLAKNNDELDKFYESCHKWLEKRYDSLHYKLFLAEIMMCVSNYANFLRSTQKFDKANKLLEMILKQFENVALAVNIDPTCQLNLQQQLIAINLEQKSRVLPERKRLATTPIAKTPVTPLNKTSRYAPLPMTVGPQNKKTYKTTTSFTIYSDRKVTQKSSSKKINIWQHSGIRKDLKFNEVEGRDEIVILSDSETEPETPKIPKQSMKPKITITADTTESIERSKSKIVKASKSKTHKKIPEDELGIEKSLEQLTIKTKKTATSDSEDHSPQPTVNKEAFKTPSSSQGSKTAVPATKSKSAQSRKKKQSSSTALCSDPSDTSSPNSFVQQTPIAAVGRRRLRTRTDAAIENSKTPSTSSRRRPR